MSGFFSLLWSATENSNQASLCNNVLSNINKGVSLNVLIGYISNFFSARSISSAVGKSILRDCGL